MRQFAGVVLLRKDGSVLAQHRDNNSEIIGPNTWCVVGGGVEEGEDLRQAAARELYEETDYKIDARNLNLLINDEYIMETGINVRRTIFWAEYDGEQQVNTNEGQEIKFISREEFSSLNFYTGHEGFLRKALEMRISRNPEAL